ncbi:hypothetical protein J1N35_036559 [Gossypium stocksii]|uniref:Uncharacterized protein n=1 Tax=Gossypium stocksii TaxID=47602 RepID=A0A9D3UI49_9ROSI|nr:hypothetical protein J1N35_036559 [Gossypium stocksii]
MAGRQPIFTLAVWKLLTPGFGRAVVAAKRLRFERGSSSAREGSGNRLTCHKRGNEQIFLGSESFVPPSAILELPTESANAVDPPTPTSAPLPAGSDLSTHHQTSHTPPIGTLYYTPPSGEVQTFFSLQKHVGVRQYPFSPFVVQQKQDRELSHELKEFTYPYPFSMLAAECGLASWALQKAYAEKEAKWAEFERTILFDEQSLNQLRQSYSAKIMSSQSSSPPRRPNTSPWRPKQGSWRPKQIY